MFWTSLLTGLSGSNYTAPPPIQTPETSKEKEDNYLAFGLIALLLVIAGAGIYLLSKK